MIICPNCADNCCIKCDVCGDLVPEQDAIYDERRERYICPDCRDWELEKIQMNRDYERELF